jgi:hypothetical protein
VEIQLTTETDDPDVIQQLLDAALHFNLLYLLQHPDTPPLYRSGVAYRREPRQVVPFEKFAGIGDILRTGHGDCDDLAPWRAAELNFRGVGARPVLVDASHHAYRTIAGGPTVRRVWHVIVERSLSPGSEEIVYEDPSARLGMMDV